MNAIAFMPSYEGMASLAKPGDPDLDLDVDGITITSVVRMGHEIWVRATGGFGFWGGSDPWSAPPGSHRAEDTEMQLVAGYPHSPEVMIGLVVAVLEQWRDQATPLRLCAATDRLMTLIEHPNLWLPWPRSGAPD